MYAAAPAVKRASMLLDSHPSIPSLWHHISCLRLVSLLFLCALDLRCATELFRTILALLACIAVLVDILLGPAELIATYAAVCWPSRPW
jgi:hypothetical protein